MAEPKDPRISIDLNILRDANLDKLEEFARQFSDPANRLAAALESFNSRAGSFGGGSGEGPGGASPDATVAGPGGVGTGQGQGGGAPSINASVSGGSPQRLQGVQRFALAGPTLNQFERGQIRLGSFPGGSTTAQTMFAASWLAGKAGWDKYGEIGEAPLMLDKTVHPDAIQGEDGGWYLPRGISRNSDGSWSNANGASGFMSKLSGGLGLAGQAAMRIPQAYNSIMGLYTNIAGAGSSQAAMGMQSGGYSRVGGWGMPFFSPAMRHSLGMDWQALQQSSFGFDPNYSLGQARAAQQAIASSGYWGNDANYLASQMRNLQVKSNMSPEETMALFDPLMRMGGEDRNRLALSLKSLNDSAKAAHIGLDQFNQSLITASEQFAQQTGMQVGQASSTLAALSAGTRLNPQALAGLGSASNMIMGAALSHQGIQDVVLGGRGAGAALAFPMMKFNMMLGMPFAQYSRLKRANPHDPRVVAAEQRISYAVLKDPNIFGGLDPRTLMAQAAKGVNISERVQAYQDATNGSFTNNADFNKLIKHFGAGGTAGHDLMAELRRQKWYHGGISKKNGNAEEAQKWLTKRMADIMNTSSDKAAHKVTITLDNWARQLVHVKGGQSKSKSNTADNVWHAAIDAAPTVAGGVIGGAVGGPVGAMLGAELGHSLGGMVGL